jgi:hypothetical protein
MGGVSRSVKFIYGSRTDVEYGYVGGTFTYFVKDRLTNIQTYLSNSSLPVRDYRLTYEPTQSVSTARSRLATLEECDSDGVCLQGKLTFVWTNGTQSFADSSAPHSNGSDQFADFNGDGRTDIIQFVNGSAYVALSNGSGFSALALWGSGLGTAYKPQIGDFNGDGLSDIAVLSPSAATVWISTGSNFNSGVVWANVAAPVSVGDFDGDGRSDIVERYVTSVPRLRIWLSSGTAFQQQPDSNCGDGSIREVHDFNGDGRDDIITYATTSTYFMVCRYVGTSFTAISWQKFGTYPLQFADINGDGKTDVVYFTGNVYAAKSTGSDFTAVSNLGVSSNGTERLADFNGDGKADLYQFSGGNNGVSYVALSTGSKFGAFAAWGGAGPTVVTTTTADFTGDGRADVYQTAGSYVWYRVTTGNPPDLLSTISADYGFANIAASQISYAPLTDASVYTRDSYATYPVKNVQDAKYVVSYYTTNNGIGGLNLTKYSYFGKKEHQYGRGELGFSRIAITAPDNSVTTTDYIQEFPYIRNATQFQYVRQRCVRQYGYELDRRYGV